MWDNRAPKETLSIVLGEQFPNLVNCVLCGCTSLSLRPIIIVLEAAEVTLKRTNLSKIPARIVQWNFFTRWFVKLNCFFLACQKQYRKNEVREWLIQRLAHTFSTVHQILSGFTWHLFKWLLLFVCCLACILFYFIRQLKFSILSIAIAMVNARTPQRPSPADHMILLFETIYFNSESYGDNNDIPFHFHAFIFHLFSILCRLCMILYTRVETGMSEIRDLFSGILKTI